MPVHSYHMVTKQQIQVFKDATKTALWEHAKGAYPGTDLAEWVFREIVFGDATCTDPLPHDLDYKNTATAGMGQYVIDAADLTADDLSSILAAGEKVEDETFIGIYGCFDNGLEAGELTGATDTPPSIGAIESIQFEGGAGVLDFWQVGHLYAFEDVVGFSDRPVIWEKKSPIKIKVCATEDTEDKSFGFRGYLLEKRNVLINPHYDPSEPMAGGIDPVQELTQEQIDHVRQKVIHELHVMAKEGSVCGSVDAAYKEGYVREIVAGDDSNDTDFVDFDQSATAQTTGQQNWAQDSSVYTAGDLAEVMVGTGKVPDEKFIGIYGFTDLTPCPCAQSMLWKDGAGKKDFWHVEHIYAYHTGGVAGITMRPLFWEQNTRFNWLVSVQAAKDTFLRPLGYIWELWGQTLSK